jgi:methionine transaminase
MQFFSKLPNVGTTIFTVMSTLAREQNAINLSQGFPDFECHPYLLERANYYSNHGFNQYAPMTGTIQLRERVAELMQVCYNASYHPETEITITAGATQGIYTALAAFIRSGDEVIVFDPSYDCYVPAIEANGGKAVRMVLEAPLFQPDWKAVENAISEKTKAIIINSPHNPSGTVLSEQDLLTLERLVQGKNILVISDEVYEHMVFDGHLHQSVARFKSLAAQSLIVSSFGKTVHTTGWKIGYVAAPKELMIEFRKIHQFLVFCVNHPFQMALSDFLSEKENYLELKNFYQKKRDYFLKLTQGARLKPLHSAGTYFQLFDYSAISQEQDVGLAMRLTKENKLASIPLSVFYNQAPTDQKLLRFCFAKKEETLDRAAEIIQKI